MTRTVPRGGHLDEAPDCSADISTCVERESSLTAEVALFFAILGFALGVGGVVKGPGWCASITLGALIFLALQPMDTLGPDVTLHSGMELALLLAAWAATLHAWRAWRRRRLRKAAGTDDAGASPATG